MRFAYADPPYIGQAHQYRAEAAANGRVAAEVDHAALIERLQADYPDGWALSLSSPSLRLLLPLCPKGTRVMAWVKDFAMAKRNVRVTYAWEPVLLMGGRQDWGGGTIVDWHQASRATARPDQTLTAKGAKPLTFCLWVLRALGFEEGDTVDDLYPGTGTMSDAVKVFLGQLRLML